MKEKSMFLRLGIFIFLLGIILYVYFFKNGEKIKDESYNGKIQHLKYSGKGYPHFMINKHYFTLSSANRNQLMKGDSLIKKKGSFTIYQYRNGRIKNVFKVL